MSMIRTFLWCIGAFLAFSSFFMFPGQADAACQVDFDSIHFRNSAGNNGDMGTDWFDEENIPFVYVDFQTIGCQNSDVIYFTVFGIPPTTDVTNILSNTFEIGISTLPNQTGGTLTFRPGENVCYGSNDGDSVGNGRECLVFGMFTNLPHYESGSEILALIGNLLGNVPLEQGETFANSPFIGGGVGPTPDCFPSNQYLFRIESSCPSATLGFPGTIFVGNLNQKLINFYNTVLPTDYSLAASEQVSATLAFPALMYDCGGLACEVSDTVWELVPNGTLPYGESHPSDTAPTTANPLSDIYEESYEPLAPLPFEGLNGGQALSLGGYLASIFKTAIVVTAILAVLMIVFHGIAHATTAAIDKKSDHREGVWNALLGLVLALGSWLLLNTINPELASELSIGIPEVSLDGYEYSAPGVASIPAGGCGPQKPPSCPTCQPIEGGIQLKPEVSVSGHNTISQGTLQKLYNFQNTLSANGISWRVTEAFQPTYMQHCSQCHYKGTCIDANFTTTEPTPQTIESFVQAAATAGLRAVYETNSQATISQIEAETDLEPSTKGGTGNYLLLNGITAPHFSVYNN